MTVKPIPEGYHTITPYFSTPQAARLIEFLKQAFGGEETLRQALPDGTIVNASVRIGDSHVMIGQAPPGRAPMPAMYYMYVPDVDAVYARAVAAGGKSIREPADQFYGDRSGAVEDPIGNQWWIATQKEQVSDAEIIKRAAERRAKS